MICRRQILKVKCVYETQSKMKAKAPHLPTKPKKGGCKTKKWSRIWQQLNCATKSIWTILFLSTQA
jgi:hypothetical protein